MKNFQLNDTVTRRLSLGICLLSALLAMTTAQKSSEAQTASDVWNRLKEADSQISASQITWLTTTTFAPEPLSEQDIEKLIASTKEEGERRHETAAQIQAITKKFVTGAEQNAKGFTKANTMVFLHQSQTTRCDVLTQKKAYFAIDYYDGINIVSLIGFDGNPNSGIRPNQGTLVRGEQPLPYSAIRPGDLLFMVGQPVTEVFHPEDSKVQQNNDGSITLEKPQKVQQLDCLLRLHLSKEDLRPVSLECVQKGTSELLFRWSAGRYKQYPGGAAFPEGFKFEGFDSAQRVSVTEDYKLLKGAFNQAADLTELRVPPGSEIGDMRFGQAHIASYTLNTKGLLPTDEKVRDFLKQQGRPLKGAVEQSNAAPASAAPQQTSTNSTSTHSAAPLALGALLMLAGCCLWGRPGKHGRT